MLSYLKCVNNTRFVQTKRKGYFSLLKAKNVT
jgi:hypothetical protein